MRELTVQELQEIDGGGVLFWVVVSVIVAGCGALGFYNGKKDTDIEYE